MIDRSLWLVQQLQQASFSQIDSGYRLLFSCYFVEDIYLIKNKSFSSLDSKMKCITKSVFSFRFVLRNNRTWSVAQFRIRQFMVSRTACVCVCFLSQFLGAWGSRGASHVRAFVLMIKVLFRSDLLNMFSKNSETITRLCIGCGISKRSALSSLIFYKVFAISQPTLT